jgi:hypothetical protein
MAGYSEFCNESLGSKKGRGFLIKSVNISFSRRMMIHADKSVIFVTNFTISIRNKICTKRRIRCRWEDCIKVNLEEIRCQNLDSSGSGYGSMAGSFGCFQVVLRFGIS